MIYITGDLHGIYDSGKLFKVKYKPDDIIIVCGDFGYGIMILMLKIGKRENLTNSLRI